MTRPVYPPISSMPISAKGSEFRPSDACFSSLPRGLASPCCDDQSMSGCMTDPKNCNIVEYTGKIYGKSMGNALSREISGYQKRGTVPYFRPYFGGISPYIDLAYGRYLQFRILKWPVVQPTLNMYIIYNRGILGMLYIILI